MIVITHDDRHFDCADRIILMQGGAITGIRAQAPLRGESPAAGAKLVARRA